MMKDKKSQEFGVVTAKSLHQKIFKKNKGIEERISKDILAQAYDEDQAKMQNLSQILNRKAEIYDTQVSRQINLKNSLVDFQLKKLQDMTESETIAYEKEREKFFFERRNELASRQKEMINSRPQIGNPSLGFQQSLQDLERNQWEQQMIESLENDLHDTNKVLDERVFVQQSYDKKLSQLEKEKLVNVVQEESEAKEKLNEFKRKRLETDQSRKEKLKKLVCLQRLNL